MHHHHHYSIADLEDMTPFEFSVYFDMTAEWIEKQKKIRGHG